jgi:hypothetical protein
MAFCQQFSEALLANTKTRQQPDLIALAYWLRKANIITMRTDFETLPNYQQRVAAGVVFHIAPGNIDTIFVYSMILSLIMGNPTIVRLPSQLGVSAQLIIDQLAAFTEPFLRNRLCLLQYAYDDAITSALSEQADLRIIWGGDNTIQHIQSLPLKYSCGDIVFPDRYSAALFNAEAVLSEDIEALVRLFYRDVVTFSQQACSSPKTIYWLGGSETINKAQEKFWALFEQLVEDETLLTDEQYFERECYKQRLAIEMGASVSLTQDGKVLRISCDTISEELERQHCGNLSLFEIKLKDLSALNNHLGDHYQTLTTWGIVADEIDRLVKKHACLKRVVAVGSALSFSHHWDGINLLSALSQDG